MIPQRDLLCAGQWHHRRILRRGYRADKREADRCPQRAPAHFHRSCSDSRLENRPYPALQSRRPSQVRGAAVVACRFCPVSMNSMRSGMCWSVSMPPSWRVNAMMRPEACFRTQHSCAGHALIEKQGENLAAQVIASGTGVFVEMNRDLLCGAWNEHTINPLEPTVYV